MAFSSEKALFETAMQSAFFRNKLANGRVLVEPRGLFGIPDLVVVDMLMSSAKSGTQAPMISACAFEMKLSNWRRALVQAFRYQAFARTSFVVLDRHYIGRALRHLNQFRKANIGLLGIDDRGHVETFFEPVSRDPYSLRLELAVAKLVLGS